MKNCRWIDFKILIDLKNTGLGLGCPFTTLSGFPAAMIDRNILDWTLSSFDYKMFADIESIHNPVFALTGFEVKLVNEFFFQHNNLNRLRYGHLMKISMNSEPYNLLWGGMFILPSTYNPKII